VEAQNLAVTATPVPSHKRYAFEDLRGKIVLVTGASTGIGAAVARAFASCGSVVVVHYNRSAEAARALVAEIARAGGQALSEAADLAQPGAGTQLVRRVAERTGGLDILVNNAGHLIERKPASEADDEHYRRIIDLNLTSTFECCRAATPLLENNGAGVIINTTSIAARMGGGPGSGIYAAAKAGVSTLTRALARELAPVGIRVNAVSPGFIRTPLHDQLTPLEAMDVAEQMIPLRRIGVPEDCAGAYLFLASGCLSGYITGQIIEVNGGLLMP
jgi:3-oxoacyl-[acyl-carrier protein] reductase